MAMILDATIAGEFANSYVTVAFADDYWDNHYSTIKRNLWQNLPSDQAKEQLLIQACRVLDSFRFTTDVRQRRLSPLQLQGYIGGRTGSEGPYRYDPWQKLQFPRHIDVTQTFAPVIPDGVSMAQCEQAVYLVTFDESALSNRLQGITMDKVAVGDISATQEYAGFGHMISPMAYDMVKDLMVRSNSIGRAS